MPLRDAGDWQGHREGLHLSRCSVRLRVSRLPAPIGPDKFGGRSGLDGRKGAEYGALISAKPGFSKIFLSKCGVE